MKRLTVFRVSAVLAILVAALRLLSPTPLELLELKALDYRHLLRGRIAPGPEVVIVGIDETSLARIGRWPWPRPRLGELIERLSDAGAAAIGLDIILDQADESVALAALEVAVAEKPDRSARDLLGSVRNDLANDERLARAFERSGRVVLGHFYVLDPEAHAAAESLDAVPLQELSVRASANVSIDSVPSIPVASAAHVSLPRFADAAAGSGHLNVFPDVDGINRRVPLAIRVGNRLGSALSLELVRRYLGGAAATVTLAPREIVDIRIGGRRIPADASGQLWVNYLGPPHSFPHVSAADVFSQSTATTAAALGGKIALVGFTALGFDEIATPFHPVAPGVELQATAIDNMLRGMSLHRPQWLVFAEAVVILMFGLAIGFLLKRLQGALGWLAALLIAILYAWTTQEAFERTGTVLSFVYPVFGILSCTLASAIFRAVVEEREKRKVRDAFSHYLNPEVTELLANEPDKLSLGGERREVTIFFSDIRNFTTISEQLTPESLGKLLNEYLEAMTDVVFQHEGLLDKYIGDAIMAFWGAPIAVPDHPQRCCRAALDMREKLGQLQRQWREQGVPPLECRIGINSGEAVVGNFGSAQRFSYTAMGDDVNLASRLENLNKEYGTGILISETTRAQIGDEFVCREIDRVVVKGRVKPVTVYELLGRSTDDQDGRLRRLADGFDAALVAYRARDWEESSKRLVELESVYPADGAINSLRTRCDRERTARS